MTIIDRFFHGRHPVNGDYGAWLSKPGINVRSTVDPNKMLLSPVAKNDQILMRGTAFTPGGFGLSAAIFFPAVLPSPPYVFYWYSVTGVTDYYPFAPDASLWQYGETTYCQVYTDRMFFYSNLGGRVVKYIVASRGIF